MSRLLLRARSRRLLADLKRSEGRSGRRLWSRERVLREEREESRAGGRDRSKLSDIIRMCKFLRGRIDR